VQNQVVFYIVAMNCFGKLRLECGMAALAGLASDFIRKKTAEDFWGDCLDHQ